MNNNEIIKNGVTIAWSAMGIARIGKDQMYAVVEETFRGAHGIEVEVFDMTVTPESIEDDEVLWLCVPTDYKVENDDGPEQNQSISGREFCGKDRRGLEESCPHCGATVELEYMFYAQPCPECGEMMLPCNICPHMDSDNYDPDMCNHCPIESQKSCRGQKRFMRMSNAERLELMEQLGVADDPCEEAFDACFEHLLECSEAYLEESDAEEEKQQFLNKYACPCGETWEDQWSCACNDRCPSCNKEIEPYVSVKLVNFNDDSTILYTPDNWDAEEHDGLKGVTGKYILDVCSGDYALADRVYALCEWQHPETVLDELKREGDDL